MSVARQLREPAITEQDLAGEATHGKVDPAIHPVEQANGQQKTLTSGIADHFIGRASRLRDQIDELIRQQRAEAEAECRRQDEYAGRTKERSDVLLVMSDAFRELSEPTGGPRVAPTLTTLPRPHRVPINEQD